MPESASSLVILARPLLPLVKTVSNHCKRLQEERKAGQSLFEESDIAGGVLDQTLDRLRGGKIDDQWWKRILDLFGQEYIAPDSLKSLTWQKWLADTEVADDLKLLAKAQIMGKIQDPEVRRRLIRSYPDRTYETQRMEVEPVDVVVAILVAGYIQSIPSEQQAVVGMVQNLQISLDRIEGKLPEIISDPITQKTHTEYAEQELSRILTLRMFNPSKSLQDIQGLVHRVLEGDLRSTNDSQKTEILIWCARLCARGVETLALAQELHDKLEQAKSEVDLSIVRALIFETEGQVDKALKLIRDREDPDSRAILFSILVRSRGEQDALNWFDKQNRHDNTSFFTSVGWVNLALSLAKSGRWEEAIKYLVQVKSLWEKSTVLSLVEGHLNAAMLLPEDFRKTALDTIPLHKNITPVLGARAKEYYSRAVICFNFAEQKLGEIVGEDVKKFIADWQLWLRLMNPNNTDAESTRKEISQNMRDGKSAVGLMRFAWAFQIEFDEEPLREHLEERKKFGGLDDREILAEFFLSEQSLNPFELVSYLEQHKESLSRVFSSRTTMCMRIEALAKNGQIEKARGLLKDNKADLGEIVSDRLNILIDSVEGNDLRNTLENLYNRTGELIDLRNLIAHLKAVNDRVALLPLLRKLFEDERNTENAKDLITCLGGDPFFDYEGIIKFLNDNEDILERSDKLREIKAWALFKLGRFRESKAINDDLLNRRKELTDLVLDIDLAITSGEWERIPEIFNREWSRRDLHSPEMLMNLAQLVSDHTQNTERALQFAKLAAEKAPDNPNILVAADYLHIRLGSEDKTDPNWLARALELSSPEDGPVRSIELSRVATEVIPQRRDHVRMVERKFINGEIPAIIAVKEFGQPLARFFLQTPQQNIEEPDGRRRIVLPIVSCGHHPVKLHKEQTVGLGITSIMVLSYLGLLEKTLAAFHHVKLAANIMELLMWDRHNVRFHQPSLVRDANQVRDIVNRNQLRIESNLAVPSQDIKDEIGTDLAELLQTAKRENGRVVCALPVHKAGSSTGLEADIEKYRSLIIPIVNFCSLLCNDEKIESHIHHHAISFLHSQNQTKHVNFAESIPDGPIYVDDLALSYLQSAGVLQSICSCGLDIRIHPYVLENKDTLIREGYLGGCLSGAIEDIRYALRNVVESGKASFLPRFIHNTEQEEDILEDLETQAIASLLKGCTEYDVLCVDDRFLNRRSTFKGSLDREVPIASTLDILRYLVSQGLIDDDDYRVACNKLRRGGFTAIPIEVDELMHWLKAATFDEAGLKESAEMRILRQSTARTYNLDVSDLQNNPAVDVGFSRICVTVIHEIWQETSLTIEQKKMLSDWVWGRLMTVPFLNPEHADKHMRGEWLQELMTTRLFLLLSPQQCELPQEQGAGYIDWIEQSVLQTVKPANANIIKEAVKAICDLISKLGDNEREIAAYLFLTHIPKSLHKIVWTLRPGLARQFGIRIFDYGEGAKLAGNDIFSVAREVLLKKTPLPVRSIDGKDVLVSIDPEDGNLVLEWSSGDSPSPQRSKDERLLLLSPDPKTRAKTLADMIKRFGPTLPDFQSQLKEIETRDLENHELQEIFDEMLNGVVAIQSHLINKFYWKSFNVTDIIPQSLRYFEQFGGPVPDGLEAESYIREVLVPYRKKLLKQDLQAGLDICCLGALRDGLLPGQWVADIDNDSLWEALSSCDVESNPFSLLGALDIALYRQDDKRFRDFSVETISNLAEGKFGQPEGTDIYGLLSIFAKLVLNRINLLEGGANQPGYWKLLHSLMQAGLITRTLIRSFSKIDTDSLLIWAFNNMVSAGFYAILADARQEPMLIILQQASTENLRNELIQRLALLKSRHEEKGNQFPKSEEIDQLLIQLTSPKPEQQEDRKQPKDQVLKNIIEKLASTKTEDSVPLNLYTPATVSDFLTNEKSEIQEVQQAVEQIGTNADDFELKKAFAFLELASLIAAYNRNTMLADEVANALIRLATKISRDEQIPRILQLLLQSAAANEDEDAWSRWLEEKLTIITHSISKDFLQLLIQHLDEIRAVLPIKLWVGVPARSIASAGS